VGHSVSLHGCRSRSNCVACVGVGLTPALKYCIATVYISLAQLSDHCDLCCMALHNPCDCRSHSSCVVAMDIDLISCGALCDHCKCKSLQLFIHCGFRPHCSCVVVTGCRSQLCCKARMAVVFFQLCDHCGCSSHLNYEVQCGRCVCVSFQLWM
jgi:hypothetical protein